MNVWSFIFLALLSCIQQSRQDQCSRIRLDEFCFHNDILSLYNYKIDYDKLSLKLQKYNRVITDCSVHGHTIRCYAENTMPLFSEFYYKLEFTVATIFDCNLPLIRINSFIAMPNLFKINMTNCNINDIEFGAFYGLSTLQYMLLNRNFITKIHKGIFNNLSNLKALDLSMNNINYIEDGCFLGNKLQEIRVSRNEIEDASPLLENCEELVIFDLSHNKVSSLESIANCTKLLVLNAENNRLKELSPYLFNQLPLVILDLSSNTLNNLDINIFNGLNILNILDLSDNKLNGQLSLGIFQDLHNLRILNLSSNSLSNLQLGIFSKLANLTILDVSNNKLNRFLEEMFYDLESMTELYINNNLLRSLKGPPFKGKINIDGNPWNCQELSKIVKFYKNAMDRGGNHNTSNIFGISCSELTSDEIEDSVDNKLNKNDDTTKIVSDTFEKFSQMLEQQFEKLFNNTFKQTETLNYSRNQEMGLDILQDFSQKTEQQLEKLLSVFNNTLQEAKSLNYSDSLNQGILQTEKLGGNTVVPHVAENSNIFVGIIAILVVLFVFLIAFCLTVIYFIRSLKVYNHIRQLDEDQL